MDEDEIWAAIDEQRTRVADLIEGLSEEQLAHPSLCDGWTVRDVAVHLTLQEMGPLDALRGLLRYPGSLNGIIHRSAIGEGRGLATGEIVARIRAMRGHRRHNVGLTCRETLTDVLVHGLDMAIPLGVDLEVPAGAAAEAATRIHGFGGRGLGSVNRRLPIWGYRLVATDTDWAVGAGQEIRGPMVALLLLVTGRTVRVGELGGPGAELLRRELAVA
jgi:uncharacterized protein (TIGR03083 family)